MRTIRICLHVGPQSIIPGLTEQEISGEVMTTIDKVYQLTAPGTICATALFAAVLTLQSNKYSFDFIDILTTFTSRSMDVFRVQEPQVSGVS